MMKFFPSVGQINNTLVVSVIVVGMNFGSLFRGLVGYFDKVLTRVLVLINGVLCPGLMELLNVAFSK
jgi:hypothetical protein